jgi:hypothetical protein
MHIAVLTHIYLREIEQIQEISNDMVVEQARMGKKNEEQEMARQRVNKLYRKWYEQQYLDE